MERKLKILSYLTLIFTALVGLGEILTYVILDDIDLASIMIFALVISLELVNTAIEAVVDLCTHEIHPLAKTAKDTAAGAVLVSAMASVIIGLMIFIPKLFN